MEINELIICTNIIVFSFFAVRMNLLTAMGALTASIIGLLIFFSFGISGIGLLGIFFITSSLLSLVKNDRKRKAEDVAAKNHKRDVVQVLANGGVPMLVALLPILNISVDKSILLLAISLASANADTWASEIGTLSKRKPRLLLNFRQVETGKSGAVSLLGTLGAIGGSFLIGISTFIFFSVSFYEVIFITIVGFIGHVVDSFLGATIQLTYQCPICHKETEKEEHCGQQTVYKKGVRLFTNDMVNIFSIVFVTVLSYFLL